MKITITLTEDQGAEFYTVQSLIGTCQLSIGQKVEKTRVSNWCTMAQVSVRITGLTEQAGEDEQLSLFDEPIKKSLPVSPKTHRKPAKQLPAPSALSIAK